MSEDDSNSDFPGLPASPETLEILAAVHKVAPTEARILIQGESSAGRRFIAKTIHEMSRRGGSPLAAIHCAAIPQMLVEGELFGREEGCAKKTNRRCIGCIEQANRSTLFLDEIDEMGQEVQVKLLRFLTDGTFERLGSNKSLRSDVRIIAATSKNLVMEVKAGRFREDLFLRLSVILLKLPSLHEETSAPGENERNYWPAPIWKAGQEELVDAPGPPITKHVLLPENVSVKFLAEITGQTLIQMAILMRQLRIFVSIHRSVDFQDAARILRRYGIGAEREG